MGSWKSKWEEEHDFSLHDKECNSFDDKECSSLYDKENSSSNSKEFGSLYDKNVVPCVTSNVVPCVTKNNASWVFKNQSSVTHGSCRIILGFQQSNKASKISETNNAIIAIKLAEWKVHNAFFSTAFFCTRLWFQYHDYHDFQILCITHYFWQTFCVAGSALPFTFRF